MGYATRDELEHFGFGEAVVGNIQVTNGIFHLVLDNVMILPDNSCNRDIRMMRCNELLLKLAEPEIAEVVEEGYTLYDADGNRRESIADRTVRPEEYANVWEALLGGGVYEIVKKSDDTGRFRYEFVIDGVEDRTYDVIVLASGDVQEWERFLNL